MTAYTLSQSNRAIRLGAELGRGGEGVIYEIHGDSSKVAKVYLKWPDPNKIQKLQSMAKVHTSDILKIAAWPVDLLKDEKGRTRGFVMPRVNAKRDIHELYSPKGRAAIFPEADFRFLVHVGANISRAFAIVHRQGHVVGDVNQGSILVGHDGTAVLIDCDSFQVRDGQKVFTCDVGVPEFTAPELQGKNFRGLLRKMDHDLFGLAAILFHLLFLGRHPFVGRFLGGGEMPPARAIAEHRFAYGKNSRSQYQMERPPRTPSLGDMGQVVARLFEKAFTSQGTNQARPEATEWISALEKLKSDLRGCSHKQWHHFPRELKSCPWCALKIEAGGFRLFGIRVGKVAAVVALGNMDIAALWQAIESVPDPGNPPLLPSEKQWSLPSGIVIPKLTELPPISGLESIMQTISRCLAISSTILLCVLLPFLVIFGVCFSSILTDLTSILLDSLIGRFVLIDLSPFWGVFTAVTLCASLAYIAHIVAHVVQSDSMKERERIRRENGETIAQADCTIKSAQSNWDSLRDQWSSQVTNSDFASELNNLREAKVQLEGIPNERQRRLTKMRNDPMRREDQRKRYLDRFRIDKGSIEGIGPSRTATLASYGIETALDIDRSSILSIPGFGEVMTASLVSWREQHERNFRFNPDEPLDPQELRKLEEELNKWQSSLVAQLKTGKSDLDRIRKEITLARLRLMPLLEKAWSEYKIAEAYRKALG